ncbi:MAG: diguanylate cyclase [Oscillospiraceae bacterium]
MKYKRTLANTLLILAVCAALLYAILNFSPQLQHAAQRAVDSLGIATTVELVFILAGLGVILIVWILIEYRQHNHAALLASQKYQSLLDHINGGLIVATHATTADETIVTYLSPGFTLMTGYTLQDVHDIYGGRYLNLLFDEDRTGAFDKYLQQLSVGNSYQMPYRLHKKDGSFIWVMDNGYLVLEADGMYNHSVLSDITVIKQQEEALRLSEERFSVAINSSSGTLFEVDLKHQLYTHFENPERIFGTSAEKLLEDTKAFSTLPANKYRAAVAGYFFHPDDWELTNKELDKAVATGTASYEARLRRADDSYIWARIDLSLKLDESGLPLRLVGFMSDIDDIKKQSERLECRVRVDLMTGLYNKVSTSELANKVLSAPTNEMHALIILDIDDFKGINDTLGHAFGDLVIVEISNKLTSLFYSDDIVGRIGGDEFAVLMKNVPDTNTVLKKAAELSGAVRQTYSGENGEYKITCSLGIFIIENNSGSFEEWYRKADAALYKAKQNGKDQFVFYHESEVGNYPIETNKTNDEELENLKVSRTMEAQIFELLYTSKDFNVSINMALATIGQHFHVSRVSIFENDEDKHTTSNIYEWCNKGVPSKIHQLQNMDTAVQGESIFDCFDENGLLYCSDVNDLPPYLRQILQAKNVLSTLKVTIVNEDKLCGFIGFDECNEHRVWLREEIEKLSFLAKVLSVFLFKKRTELALLDNLHTRLKILDVLPDYICVVNPETHSLVYTNSKMRELLPSVYPGAFCFASLRGGQDGPCEECLVERIKRGDTDNLEIVSEDKNVHLAINALSINWTNNKQMVLLYGIERKSRP